MNSKERRLALLSALSYKNKEKNIVVVDNIDLAGNKTKDMLNALKSLELNEKKVLVIIREGVKSSNKKQTPVELVTYEVASEETPVEETNEVVEETVETAEEVVNETVEETTEENTETATEETSASQE